MISNPDSDSGKSNAPPITVANKNTEANANTHVGLKHMYSFAYQTGEMY